MKGWLPMVNVMFGMVEMLLQLIIDSPDGLGRLSQSCKNPKQKYLVQLIVVFDDFEDRTTGMVSK